MDFINHYFTASGWEVRAVSAGIMVLLLVGIALRRLRRIHPPIMIGCFLADLGLVLYLELTRKAVESAVTHLSTLMIVHIALSTTMLALYIALIVSGVKLLRGRGSRRLHGLLALTFVLVRFAVMTTAVGAAQTVHPGV